MSINWSNLRPWNGSQALAFEELCCQLAGYEQVPDGSKFIRKGSPDAGVECYWKLPDGSEWGWQAKFFLSPPGKNQWPQIDNSIKTALDKHPDLSKYTICLPIDRIDPRIENQKSFMDRWNDRVKKWTTWSQEKNMSVEFIYWGEHEIFERLSSDEHRGRYFFWFKKELFSCQWFKDRVDEAIANAGPRYTPELNVDLDISQLFDGLGLTQDFYVRLMEMYAQVKKSYSNLFSDKIKGAFKTDADSLKKSFGILLTHLKDIEQDKVDPIDIDSIKKLIPICKESSRKWLQELAKPNDKENQMPQIALNVEDQIHDDIAKSYTRTFESERTRLQTIISNLNNLEYFIKSSEVMLANISALLLSGDAGTGKTHLFCDVAKQRISSGLPTVLLLGGHFDRGEPWSQIIRLLGLSCTREEFLGALQVSAQAEKAKAIILIDALNEGEGRFLWEKHIGGIINILSRYPWVSIAFSVRTSYEDLVIPEKLIPDKLVREVHYGFSDYEYEAAGAFFDYYGIVSPNIPLLVPEFQNPLFLKLFCLGLKNQGLTRIPSGFKGINAIFNFFIGSINKKLSRPENLDFDEKSQVLQKAVDKVAEMMGEQERRRLLREEAQKAVNAFLPNRGHENSLFKHMISEGILSEDIYLDKEKNWCDVIYFTYDRFSDHIIAKYYLDKHLDSDNPSKSFMAGKPLGSLIKDEFTCLQNSGLIEALSIQLPERLKKELVEVAPGCADYQPINEAFIDSLIWRTPDAFSDATLKHIKEHITKDRDMHDLFIKTVLTIASIPEHPYNADFLHEYLMKFKLAARDSWWSSFFLALQGKSGSVVYRIIEWAWSPGDKSHIDDNTIRLFGIALTWFLTTPNRYLRDKATKALISILTNRIHILRKIIHSFLNVDDLYILERLFATAYGCTMRSTDDKAVQELAEDIYEWIFKSGKPIPHILLRDYARNVIELALYRGAELQHIDIKKIRPPYKSEWPTFRIPTREELEKYGKVKKGMSEEELALSYLHRSVMRDGDFARYVIGTNWSYLEKEAPLNLSTEQCWIFQKVLNLGWTVERFGGFDRRVQYNSTYKTERIGKKYQWLAYHEFLARTLDNFESKVDKWSGTQKYEGPWQVTHGRDIDPSCLLKKMKRQSWESKSHDKNWWSLFSYDCWKSEPDDVKWLRGSADLPDFTPLIEVKKPQDNSKWLVLEAFYKWDQPRPPGEGDIFEFSSREIWYMLKS